MFTDDYVRLSRPTYYLNVDIAGPATAEAFVAFSAEHTINTDSQKVSWSSDGTTTKIGNADQNVLGSKGDRVNIDWGYLHVLPTDGASAWAGSLSTAQSSFTSSGALPVKPDTRMPRAVSDDLPGAVSRR